MQISPREMEVFTADSSSGRRQANQISEIIVHCVEELNNVDLNVLSGVQGCAFLHAPEMYISY